MDEEQRRRLPAKAKIKKEEDPIWSVRIDPGIRDRFTAVCAKADLKLFKTLEFLMEEFAREEENSRKRTK